MVPVHPHHCWLLGTKWQGKIYVDITPPFGLRSAPKIFIANGLYSSVARVKPLHYLDDFLFMGAPRTKRCQESLQLVHDTCNWLGVPFKYCNVEGPATQLVFLGIMLDTHELELCLPEEKLVQLTEMITRRERKKYCWKKIVVTGVGSRGPGGRLPPPFFQKENLRAKCETMRTRKCGRGKCYGCFHRFRSAQDSIGHFAEILLADQGFTVDNRATCEH